MRVLAAVLFLACLSSLASAAANDPSTVLVCVATPQNMSYVNASTSVTRDQLVYQVNHGQKKKAKVKIEALGMESSRLGDAEAEAKDKSCRYLVLSEFKDMMTMGTGTGFPGDTTPSIGPRSRTNPRNFGLNYRIVRVGSATMLDDGALSPGMGQDESDGVFDLTRQLAVRVVHVVLKASPGE